jgi:CheY-like chemotaxis protein
MEPRPTLASRSRRILVVDDDPDLAEVLDRVLEKSGYMVTWAKNGQEALRALRDEEGLEVVLLDLMMPVMNGWEFRAEQLKDPALSKIPVVVFSGHGKLEQNAISIGAVANLRKPIGLHELLSVLDQIFDRPEGPQ